MSEVINNTEEQKKSLKALLLQIHHGTDPEILRSRLVGLLQKIPYDAVVEVEQALLAEGLPVEELMEFCTVHSQVLGGHITAPELTIPPGHPLDLFKQENEALKTLAAELKTPTGDKDLRLGWQKLTDVDKHYRRKEYLVFPYLEKAGIEGPPKVMWGKHDEIRGKIKTVWEGLKDLRGLESTAALRMEALEGVLDMISKEEQIFLPLCQEILTEDQWAEVQQQTVEYGFCLIDPTVTWVPDTKPLDSAQEGAEKSPGDGLIRLFSGQFNPEELTAVLNALPVDLTFVDAQDKVRYFSQGKERIFDRSRAILGRDVRLCHPPHSVGTVEKILGDFKAGKEDRAPFWIQLGGQFIHIEYFALRNPQGVYLGCLEVSQNLTEKRRLEGEQRLLSYGAKDV